MLENKNVKELNIMKNDLIEIQIINSNIEQH